MLRILERWLQVKVKLLKEGYSTDLTIYEDFIKNEIDSEKDYFSDEYIIIDNAPDFPIYMGEGSKKKRRELYREAINVLINHYIELPRSTHTSGVFWHSLLIQEKRSYLIEKYPQILESKNKFDLIVFRDFDWENYIYKCVYAAEYIYDTGITDPDQINHYSDLIYDNMDLYNYIIKTPLFRNSQFVMKFLKVIDEENLSEKLKAKIPNRPELGDDVRYGREVIQELNKSYPILNSPALDVEDLGYEVRRILKSLE